MNVELSSLSKTNNSVYAISVAFYKLHFSENYSKLRIYPNSVLYIKILRSETISLLPTPFVMSTWIFKIIFPNNEPVATFKGGAYIPNYENICLRECFPL